MYLLYEDVHGIIGYLHKACKIMNENITESGLTFEDLRIGCAKFAVEQVNEGAENAYIMDVWLDFVELIQTGNYKEIMNICEKYIN